MTTPPPPLSPQFPAPTTAPPELNLGTLLLVVAALTLAQITASMLGASVSAMYPLLRQVGMQSYQFVGVMAMLPVLLGLVLQPIVGVICDKWPLPFLLPVGLALSAAAVGLFGLASNSMMMLGAAMLLGIGQAIFRPEGARAIRLAANGWQGSAMGLFFATMYAGSVAVPLLTMELAQVGQRAAIGFAACALPGIATLVWVADWHLRQLPKQPLPYQQPAPPPLVYQQPFTPRNTSTSTNIVAILVLLATAVAKSIYLVGMSSVFSTYLAIHLSLPVKEISMRLILQTAVLALGILVGGILSDWVGQRVIILGSVVATLLVGATLPYVGSNMLIPQAAAAFFLLGLGMSPILTALQDLAPKLPGLMAGLFFGVAYGVGSIIWMLTMGAVRVLGATDMFRICSYVPFLGLIALLLPLVMRHELRPARTSML